MLAAQREALQVGQVLAAVQVADQDLPDVPVVLEGEQLLSIDDPLRGLLADEEVALTADDGQQLVVLVLVGAERLDAVQQLVVVQCQPALFRSILLRSLHPVVA